MRIASRTRTIAIAIATLTGCTGVHHTPVGPTCVSCKPYYCRGSWHYPQLYYEYSEVGLASWYGDDCHGKQKATGETFDKMAMTAAHKTLPLPSVVRVTSLVTGKSVVVVVDDRGPYVYTGRIIDLSYGVAMRLGIHNRKPSNVRVEVLVEDSVNLSRYIARYCRNRRDPFGRSWNQVYFQEINRTAMPVPMYTSESSNYQLSKKGIRRTDHRRSVAGHSKARKSLIGHINKL